MIISSGRTMHLILQSRIYTMHVRTGATIVPASVRARALRTLSDIRKLVPYGGMSKCID